MKKFNVKVDAAIKMQFQVKARNKKEAREKAREIIEESNILAIDMPSLSQRHLEYQINPDKNK